MLVSTSLPTAGSETIRSACRLTADSKTLRAVRALPKVSSRVEASESKSLTSSASAAGALRPSDLMTRFANWKRQWRARSAQEVPWRAS